MKIVNDNNCGWLMQLPKRENIIALKENLKCDYLIIGAGFTGLSAARQLGKIQKNKKIIIVDAQLAGEGASSRNSGYLVDTTLNDGFTSNKDYQDYIKKVKIYEYGINSVKKFKEKTSCPVVVNTSFNVRGEPIVNTPKDAYDCFMGTELDILVIGNCYLIKKEQNPSLKKDYTKQFELD